jgi:hypothetical protein
LADDHRAFALDAIDEQPGRPERQHDRNRPPLQSEIEKSRLLRQAPGDESDAKARFRLLEHIKFPREPFLFAVAAAKNAKPSGSIYCSDETPIGHGIHRGEQNGMIDAKQLCDRRCDHGCAPLIEPQDGAKSPPITKDKSAGRISGA